MDLGFLPKLFMKLWSSSTDGNLYVFVYFGKIPEHLEMKWDGLFIVKDEGNPGTGP